jgi:serine/threonine-protein kinase
MAKHGRYKIGRKVADGGMAEIFLATQLGREGFAKPVILKRIHSSIYADPQFRNMFIDEAHISMSLSHSNIVQILDLGAGAGRYFLVLEFVDGWDLGRVLQRGGAAGMPLPRELGLYIAGQVCRALEYAHSKTAADAEGERPLGIVHRDVSPHNILLSDQGEVKLTDFGIAKAMNKREHTGTGVVKGKVAFMSPEQAMGRTIDPRSDLFALGTVLYLLMARVRPFTGGTDLETLLRVQKAEFRPPEEAAPDLPPEVAAVINRAMQLDPAARYQSADEMLADIERVARTVYLPVGQTELKKYLADLSARDGVASIGKAAQAAQAARPGTGSGELEGKDVVLLDSSQEYDESEEGDMVDGEGQTSLAVVGTGSSGARRLTRAREELALPVPDDAEAALSGRQSRSEFSLPVPEEEGPPGRRRARRGGGLWIVLFGLLLIGGAAVAGRYLGLRAEDEHGVKAQATPPPQPAAAAATTPAHAAGGAPGAATAETPPQPDEKAPGHHVAEGASEREREHEGHKNRPPAEKPRRAIDELKGMMAPDPSLLPAPSPPTPPPAPKPVAPAETPPAPAPSSP